MADNRDSYVSRWIRSWRTGPSAYAMEPLAWNDTGGTWDPLEVDASGNLKAVLGANSGIDIGDVGILSQPARDRLVDNIGVAQQTDVILDDTSALTPKFAVISASAASNVIVSAVVGKKIRVLSYVLVSSHTAVMTAQWKDGASAALTGAMSMAPDGGGGSAGFCPVGWFETASGQSLDLALSLAQPVAGHLTYVEV